jgi:uncharacterized protein
LNKNHTGLISIGQIAKGPVFLIFMHLPYSLLRTNNNKAITNAIVREFGTHDSISIDKQFDPLLKKSYENATALNLSNCNNVAGCPVLLKSHFSLMPTLSMIGSVSKSTGILILNGEIDSDTPVQQAFLLQQRLTDVNHPDHTLVTYPNLGHSFYLSSHWLTRPGPIEPYVLALSNFFIIRRLVVVVDYDSLVHEYTLLTLEFQSVNMLSRSFCYRIMTLLSVQ